MPGPYGAARDKVAIKAMRRGGVKTPPYGATVNGMQAERGKGGRKPSPSAAATEVGAMRLAAHFPLRGFGGTPDSKVEQGPAALSANSNTAFA